MNNMADQNYQDALQSDLGYRDGLREGEHSATPRVTEGMDEIIGCDEHGRDPVVTEQTRTFIKQHPGMFSGVRGRFVGQDEADRRRDALRA